MQARITTVVVAPDRHEQAIAFTQEKAVPTMQADAGFLGGYVLADHHTGEVLLISFWESEAAADASSADASTLRGQAALDLGLTVDSVRRYNVEGQLQRSSPKS